jgi:hypothetical protein
MTRSKKSHSSLGKLARRSPSLGDHFVILHQLQTLDDRAAAILAAIQVEAALESVLLRKMIPLPDKEINEIFVGDSAPLSTFSAKIRMAFALGIIGPEARHDLNRLRTIRNAFAHARMPVSFDTSEIVEVCASIQFLSRLARPQEGPDYPKGSSWPPAEPKRQYLESSGFIAAALLMRGFELAGSAIGQDEDLLRILSK